MPRSAEKRPIRLRLEIKIDRHSKYNRLCICDRRPKRVRAMSHSCVCHDSLVCAPWLIHMCDLHDHTQCNDAWIYVRDVDVPITCVPWLIRMCSMTHSHVWPAQSQRVTRCMPCPRASPLLCTPVFCFSNNKETNSAAAASSVFLFLGDEHPFSSLSEADGEHPINHVVSSYNCTRISCLILWCTICHVTFLWKWLRLVGCLKLQIAFVEYRLFYRVLLQKRPVIWRSLLIVATLYASFIMSYILMYVLSRHIAMHHFSRHFPHTYIKQILSYTPQTYPVVHPANISSVVHPAHEWRNLHSWARSSFPRNFHSFLHSWAEKISVRFSVRGRRKSPFVSHSWAEKVYICCPEKSPFVSLFVGGEYLHLFLHSWTTRLLSSWTSLSRPRMEKSHSGCPQTGRFPTC